MTIYYIHEIFPCVQGEGTLVGTPMALVRLQGCNLRCPWCDTVAAQEVTPVYEFSGADLVEWMRAQGYLSTGWTLITGGEPAIWELSSMVNALRDAGQSVAVETNGTLPINATINWLCVSPKLDVPGGGEIDHQVLRQANEVKFVIGNQGDLDLVDQFMATRLRTQRFGLRLLLQPKWGVPGATELCYRTVISRGRPWRLSLQTHKLIGVP